LRTINVILLIFRPRIMETNQAQLQTLVRLRLLELAEQECIKYDDDARLAIYAELVTPVNSMQDVEAIDLRIRGNLLEMIQNALYLSS
jgi:hypothetical protein